MTFLPVVLPEAAKMTNFGATRDQILNGETYLVCQILFPAMNFR